MKRKIMMAALMATALYGLTATACLVQVHVGCPNDRPAVGVQVCIAGAGCARTDDQGIASIQVPDFGNYSVCVTAASLPAGATLSPLCQNIKVETLAPPVLEFVLSGSFCSTPPSGGQCWLTGGGTIDKVKGTPHYSFGGVVYPGCSPRAADGGNWNVVDHFQGLHFQGQHIVVDSCSGVATRSPRVNVNIIDFHGNGIISGIGGNPNATIPVTFVGRAIDNLEPGRNVDLFYLRVTSGNTTVMQIGNSATDPVAISTGNLQIHTSSCGR